MRAVILFLALLGSAMAVPNRMPGRIVGGESTTVEEYPFMANMQYQWLGVAWTQWCGGTLINDIAVVTAAQCFESRRPSKWRARLGTSRASSGGTEYYAETITIHPEFDDLALTNDIAIVKFNTTVAFNDAVAPVNLPSSSYNLPDDSVVTVIGWGDLSSGGSSPAQLRKVDINIINQELCAERYDLLQSMPGFYGWPDVTDDMLCAGILNVGGKGACEGDSGGPLVYQDNTLVGIVSWSYLCAHRSYPGVFTRVSQYIDWIDANAQ